MPCGTKSFEPPYYLFSGTVETRGLEDTRYHCSLHLYAPRHSCFVPPHTTRSEDTCQNPDVRPLIGCVVSTLAGLASSSGPIAAGTLQTVPAFTDSPHPSVIRTMHPRSQQSHCRHLRLVQELRRNTPGKISRPAIDSVGGGPWEQSWLGSPSRPWIRCFEPTCTTSTSSFHFSRLSEQNPVRTPTP